MLLKIFIYIYALYRYPIDTRRSIYMFRDGSQAVDAKNYLLEQPELSHLTLEGQTYYRDAQQQVMTYIAKTYHLL